MAREHSYQDDVMERPARTYNPSFVRPPATHPAGDIASWTTQYDTPDHETVASIIHSNPWRWPPSEVPDQDEGYLDVPERYNQEKLYSDPDTYRPPRQHSQEIGPDPRWDPRQPDRRIYYPAPYRFFRPFQKDVAERYTGDHFSMAAHTRNYPIYGMEPWDDWRNTYRTMPPPRDITIEDRPPDVEPDTPVAVHVSQAPQWSLFGRNNGWRA